jgi:hypothetical protein
LCNACGLRWSRNKRKSGIDDERAARRTRGVRVRRKPVQTKEELNDVDEEDDAADDASEDEETEEWLKRDREEDSLNNEDSREDNEEQPAAASPL